MKHFYATIPIAMMDVIRAIDIVESVISKYLGTASDSQTYTLLRKTNVSVHVWFEKKPAAFNYRVVREELRTAFIVARLRGEIL